MFLKMSLSLPVKDLTIDEVQDVDDEQQPDDVLAIRVARLKLS
jgi:hypothetical protein